MRALAGWILVAGLLPGVSLGLTFVQAYRDVPLSRRDAAAVEAIVCRKPHGVPAHRALGQRYILRGGGKKPLAASVSCEAHLVTDQYQVYDQAWCVRERSGWRCEPAVSRLRIDFLGRGPYEVILGAGVVPGEASAAIRRLERDLGAHPEALDGHKADWLGSIGPVEGAHGLSLDLGAQGNCYSFVIDLAREPGGDPRPPQFSKADCLIE